MKTAFLAALALVCASAAVAGPRDMPIASCNMPVCESAFAPSSVELKRAARGLRTPRSGFGSVMQPGETQRGFLNSLSGVVPALAAKVASIQAACAGTTILSTVRHTRIFGTRVMSLHAQGKAVDVAGNYSCIYAQLQGWPGGYSTDSGRVRHVHISLDDGGGREMGLRFVHGGARKWSRHARARAAARRQATAFPR